jgi:hypothetical protein
MTAHLTGVAAATTSHVLAAAGFFTAGFSALQITLELLLVLLGGGGASILIFWERKVSQGILMFILIIWVSDVVANPTFYRAILHAFVAKLLGVV